MTSYKAGILNSQLINYIHENGFRPHQVKQAIIAQTEELFPNKAQMVTMDIQGELIQMLVKSLNAQKCIQVGVFTGYSALCIALGMPETGKLVALDISQQFTNIAKKHWKNAGIDHKIQLRLAPASESLRALIQQSETGKVDFIYIDADKANQTEYYQLSVQLLRSGGMLLIDNILSTSIFNVVDLSDQREQTNAVRETTRHINRDPRVKSCILPISDGTFMIVKNQIFRKIKSENNPYSDKFKYFLAGE